MQTRVIKVGGSLLDWPPLPAALRHWLEPQPPAFNVLLCGGGNFGGAIRQADRDFSLGEDFSHWLCIDVMSITARLFTQAAHLPMVTNYDELLTFRADRKPKSVVFDAAQFLRDREPQLPGHRLPHDWSVTSDSIAARLAEVLPADELVLLKSSDPPPGSVTEFVAAGYVDRQFSAYSAIGPPLTIINLRGTSRPA